VIATGTFQAPRIPTFSQAIAPGLAQLHSSRYRNPEQLPPGGALVVGSGQSGCQITEELNEGGRDVYLCTSGVARAPRTYRGKDFTWWLVENGFVDRTVADLPSPDARFNPNPHVTGKDGGHTLNLHQFAKDGVTLLGHMEDASGWRVRLADNLMDNLKQADEAAAKMKQGIDTFIEKAGIDAPEEDQPVLKAGYDAEVMTELDLDAAGIRTIIWATGYTWDYSWIGGLDVDEFGYPVQERGVTQQKGLYFVGLHWLHTLKSGLLLGVGDDAAHIANHIDGRS
jgi:putative flavoprotein involved in K+ transport